MRLSPMKIVERNMMRPSYRRKGQGHRNSQLVGQLRDHPTLMPLLGEKKCRGGLGTGQGRHRRDVAQHMRILMTAVDGTSNGIGSKRNGTIFTSISSDNVQLAKKLARRLKGRNVI